MNEIQQILKGFYVNVAIGMILVCLFVLGIFLIRYLFFKTMKSHKKENYKGLSDHLEATAETITNEFNAKDDLICPKCGNKLVLRAAKKGDNAGNQFYGCSSFPKCRYVKNL